jgi:hypothetical protein
VFWRAIDVFDFQRMTVLDDHPRTESVPIEVVKSDWHDAHVFVSFFGFLTQYHLRCSMFEFDKFCPIVTSSLWKNEHRFFLVEGIPDIFVYGRGI